jgi:hypothetical protein
MCEKLYVFCEYMSAELAKQKNKKTPQDTELLGVLWGDHFAQPRATLRNGVGLPAILPHHQRQVDRVVVDNGFPVAMERKILISDTV